MACVEFVLTVPVASAGAVKFADTLDARALLALADPVGTFPSAMSMRQYPSSASFAQTDPRNGCKAYSESYWPSTTGCEACSSAVQLPWKELSVERMRLSSHAGEEHKLSRPD